MDIYGANGRGPFDTVRHRADSRCANLPGAVGHDAKRERRMIVEPDSEDIVREGLRDKAVAVWGTATRLHCTLARISHKWG